MSRHLASMRWRFERASEDRAAARCYSESVARVGLEMGRAMERAKNAGLVFCLFVVLLVVFSSSFRANELGTLFGALTGTPVLVHVFNRLAPRRRDSHRGWTPTGEPVARTEPMPRPQEQVLVLRMEGPNGQR